MKNKIERLMSKYQTFKPVRDLSGVFELLIDEKQKVFINLSYSYFLNRITIAVIKNDKRIDLWDSVDFKFSEMKKVEQYIDMYIKTYGDGFELY